MIAAHVPRIPRTLYAHVASAVPTQPNQPNPPRLTPVLDAKSGQQFVICHGAFSDASRKMFTRNKAMSAFDQGIQDFVALPRGKVLRPPRYDVLRYSAARLADHVEHALVVRLG